MWIPSISPAFSCGILQVCACTKRLLCLFWYAEGTDCDGKGPKHLCGFFWIVCLSLNWYPGANTQPGIWFLFSGTRPVWKQKKSTRDEGKGHGSFLDIIQSTSGFFYSFYYLLWCKQGSSRCCFPPYVLKQLSFVYNSCKLLPVKNRAWSKPIGSPPVSLSGI